MRQWINLVETLQRPNINDAFWRWFGDSKVVDSVGQPLVVYHGTADDVAAFDRKRIGSVTDGGLYGRGFYFSPSHGNGTKRGGTAGGYAAYEYGGNIIPVYLSIQNPLKVMSANWAKVTTEMLDGHDGVFVHEGFGWEKDGPLQEIVALKPIQIKSIFNRGTWSLSDDRISY